MDALKIGCRYYFGEVSSEHGRPESKSILIPDLVKLILDYLKLEVEEIPEKEVEFKLKKK